MGIASHWHSTENGIVHLIPDLAVPLPMQMYEWEQNIQGFHL